jgi:hypothetical protein
MIGVEAKFMEFHGEDGSRLRLYVDNMGEPYRGGITMMIENQPFHAAAFLENHEVDKVINWLQAMKKARK